MECQMKSSRSLKQLTSEVLRLDINDWVIPKKQKNGKEKIGKNELIEALRKYYILDKWPEGLPIYMKMRLAYDQPMVAARFSNCKFDLQEDIIHGDNWIFEEKFDGIRAHFIYQDGELHVFSRNNSVTDHLPVEYKTFANNFNSQHIELNGITSFIIDGEIISLNPNIIMEINKRGIVQDNFTKTQLQAVQSLLSLSSEQSLKIQQELGFPLQLQVFDILEINENDLKDKSWKLRRLALERLFPLLILSGLNVKLSEYVTGDKKLPYLENILNRNGEGVIAKNICSKYNATSVRKKDGFVKIKRTLQGIGGDEIEAYVTGFELGQKGKAREHKVGSLIFSILLKKEDGQIINHEIAQVSSISDSLRDDITVLNHEGQPTLRPDFYNKVASIDGQAVSSRLMRFKHATIKDWRIDKNPDDCVIDEVWLKKQIV